MSNIQNAEKKFTELSNTQEGIQSMSLWVIYHKGQSEKIVNVWFKVLKKSKAAHRLTLFYLCNDVVQTCKRKGASMYKSAFKSVLKDAVPLVRDNSVKSNIERIFRIWGERGIYDQGFIDEIQSLLAYSKARAAANSRLLSDFKPQKVLEKLLTFRKFELETELKKTQLNSTMLDISHTDVLRQLKDRRHSKEFSMQYEESCKRLEEYVSCLEKEIRDRSGLTVLLEQSELYYDAQFGEARIVANAYKNFGSRVSNMKRKLDSVIQDLPNAPSPIPSPTIDVPSPGNTPPYEQNKLDNTDAIDMDMSDTEQPKTIPIIMEESKKYKRRKKSRHSKRDPDVEIIEEKNTNSFVVIDEPNDPVDLKEEISNWNSVPDASNNSTPAWTETNPAETFNDSTSFTPPPQTGDSTPVKDECPGTPVQDEPTSNPVSASANSVEAAVNNPIEFLTQLISQTQGSNPESSQKQAPSINFLQSLTALSQQSNNSTTDEAANTWAQWKAQSHKDPVPHMGASHVTQNISPTGSQPPTLSNIIPTAVPPPIFTSHPHSYDPPTAPTSPTIMYPSSSRVMPTPPTPNYSTNNLAPLTTPPIKPTYTGMNQSPPFMSGPATPMSQWQATANAADISSSGIGMGGSNMGGSNVGGANDQQDFIDKLKRRSSISNRSDDRNHDASQPTGPPPQVPHGPPPTTPLGIPPKPTGPPPAFTSSNDNMGGWNNDKQTWNQQNQQGGFYDNNQQQQQNYMPHNQQQYGFNTNVYQQHNLGGFPSDNNQYPKPSYMNMLPTSSGYRPRF